MIFWFEDEQCFCLFSEPEIGQELTPENADETVTIQEVEANK